MGGSNDEIAPLKQPATVPPSSSSDDKVTSTDKPLVDEGTHQELMYALGVNLARQLGDIRPLVEDGDELTLVAKGLLDTVIGRITEEGQSQLLARRGKDLNLIITDRANNIRQRLEDAGKEMLKTMEETDGTEKLDTGVILHVLEPGPGFG